MKKTILSVCMVFASLLGADAAVVTFGEGSNGWENWVGGTASNVSMTVITNGVSFTLTATSSGGELRKFSAVDGSSLVVGGGERNDRIDDGLTSATNDDEFITFTLSVAGVELETLSLDALRLATMAEDESRGEVWDEAGNMFPFDYITNSPSNFGAQPELNYSTMTNLNALSLANVGGQGDSTWTLTVYAREGVNSNTIFQIDDVSFQYTVPETTSTTLTFGEPGITDWNTWVGGTTGETATDITATYETNGVTFSLQMVGSNPLRKFGGGDGSTLVEIGGNSSGRLDNADAGTADDESITFRLSVSGKELESISLESIGLFYNANPSTVELLDGDGGSASITRTTEPQSQEYYAAFTVLTNLTPLSVANVGGQGDNAWEFSVHARDGALQFDDITFRYDLGSTVVVTNMGPLTIESLPGGTNLQIRWESVAGASYRLLETSDLVSGNWQTNTFGIAATPPENTNMVSVIPVEAFFKVEVEQ